MRHVVLPLWKDLENQLRTFQKSGFSDQDHDIIIAVFFLDLMRAYIYGYMWESLSQWPLLQCQSILINLLANLSKLSCFYNFEDTFLCRNLFLHGMKGISNYPLILDWLISCKNKLCCPGWLTMIQSMIHLPFFVCYITKTHFKNI